MRRLAILATSLLLGGCATDRADDVTADVERAILQRTGHELSWNGYDGTGDPETARYTLDRQPIGIGRSGFEELRRLVAKMPKGSKVDIGPYYVNEGGGRRIKYPFDTFELYNYCKQYGVLLGVPNAR